MFPVRRDKRGHGQRTSTKAVFFFWFPRTIYHPVKGTGWGFDRTLKFAQTPRSPEVNRRLAQTGKFLSQRAAGITDSGGQRGRALTSTLQRASPVESAVPNDGGKKQPRWRDCWLLELHFRSGRYDFPQMIRKCFVCNLGRVARCCAFLHCNTVPARAHPDEEKHVAIRLEG